MSDVQKVTPTIRMVVDQFGDPSLYLDVTLPPGTSMPLEDCEAVAIAILTAAAAARARAGLIRKQLLAGSTALEAVEMARSLLDD